MDVIFFAIVTSIGMFMAYHSGKFSMVKQVFTVLSLEGDKAVENLEAEKKVREEKIDHLQKLSILQGKLEMVVILMERIRKNNLPSVEKIMREKEKQE